MAYDNTNSGVLFRNDQKTPEDQRPDYTGKINVGGVEKRLAAWIKQGQNGKFMSLKVTDPQQQQADPARQEPLASDPGPSAQDDPSDLIPF